jgi:hypothetical protein
MWLPFLRIRIRVLAAAAAVVSASGSVASAVTIDDFSVGSIEVARTGTTAASAQQTGLDPLHVLGGGRSFSVGAFGGSVQRLVVDAPAGELRFATDTNGYFQITYGSLAEPLNLDLTATGSNAFLFHITYAVPNTPLALIPGNTFRVVTSTGTRFGSMTAANIVAQADGSRLIRVPFSSLSGQGDFKMVQRIEYELFRVPPGSHFTLRKFATVPEPSTGILSILAGVTYGRRTLRRFRS